MRPTRDRRALLLPTLTTLAGWLGVVGGLAGLGMLPACGKQSLDPAEHPSVVVASPGTSPGEPGPLEVFIGDPVSAPPVVPPARADLARGADVPREPAGSTSPPDLEPEPDTLPKTWTGPLIPGLTFADALRRARGARDGFARLVPPPTSAKEASVKAWFGQAQALVDQASRMYAAAFHAPDAPREGRVEAIAEAAELDMTMARSLDEAGLGTMPVTWRADPTVASTFEDVAIGPTRRWRDEARVLARQCIDVARQSGVLTEAARRCAGLRTGVAPRLAKGGADAGAGCACSPGDPLCSASLGGWCPPAAH